MGQEDIKRERRVNVDGKAVGVEALSGYNCGVGPSAAHNLALVLITRLLSCLNREYFRSSSWAVKIRVVTYCSPLESM